LIDELFGMGSSTSSVEKRLRSALPGDETVLPTSGNPASSTSRLTPRDGGAARSASAGVVPWAATPAVGRRHRMSVRATDPIRREALRHREPGARLAINGASVPQLVSRHLEARGMFLAYRPHPTRNLQPTYVRRTDGTYQAYMNFKPVVVVESGLSLLTRIASNPGDELC